MRTKLALLLSACIAAAGAAACNGDNSNPDAGDAAVVPDTGGQGVVTDGGGGDGACNFATFVIGLIQNDTNGTALPSTDLGQNCVDDHDAAEFQSLFP
jgi:hypothetical protein